MFELDRTAAMPLHEQLELMLRERIRRGRLVPESRLPSTRTLARELGVSRGVVLEAYAQLIAEGYLIARQGAPTRVAAVQAAERPPMAAASLQPRHRYELDPALPDLAALPREQWLRSQRAAMRRAPFAALGYGDPRGAPELRNELMGYLGRVRGAAAEPEHTLICAGFTQAFACLCRALRARGVERIAVEQPCWARHRLIAEAAGLALVPVAVDGAGLDAALLAESGCEVVVVTPAHQFPTGVVLSPERRSALLDWAEEEDGLIVEDDYDSELRYDRVAVGALQGLAPERVCHIGSVSKRLAPGLRIGWVLSPSWLTGAFTYEQAVAGEGAPTLDQLALADFLARGELDRHLRRMRLSYRTRREATVAALGRELPDARLTGVEAGLFLTVVLGSAHDEARVLAGAAARGVAVEGLGSSWLRRAGSAGIVLGYANHAPEALARAIAALGEAVGQGSGL